MVYYFFKQLLLQSLLIYTQTCPNWSFLEKKNSSDIFDLSNLSTSRGFRVN